MFRASALESCQSTVEPAALGRSAQRRPPTPTRRGQEVAGGASAVGGRASARRQTGHSSHPADRSVRPLQTWNGYGERLTSSTTRVVPVGVEVDDLGTGAEVGELRLRPGLRPYWLVNDDGSAIRWERHHRSWRLACGQRSRNRRSLGPGPALRTRFRGSDHVFPAPGAGHGGRWEVRAGRERLALPRTVGEREWPGRCAARTTEPVIPLSDRPAGVALEKSAPAHRAENGLTTHL